MHFFQGDDAAQPLLAHLGPESRRQPNLHGPKRKARARSKNRVHRSDHCGRFSPARLRQHLRRTGLFSARLLRLRSRRKAVQNLRNTAETHATWRSRDGVLFGVSALGWVEPSIRIAACSRHHRQTQASATPANTCFTVCPLTSCCVHQNTSLS